MTTCANPNCQRETDWTTPPSRARYCRTCTTYLWRHGTLPVIAAMPEWLRRLTARELSTRAA